MQPWLIPLNLGRWPVKNVLYTHTRTVPAEFNSHTHKRDIKTLFFLLTAGVSDVTEQLIALFFQIHIKRTLILSGTLETLTVTMATNGLSLQFSSQSGTDLAEHGLHTVLRLTGERRRRKILIKNSNFKASKTYWKRLLFNTERNYSVMSLGSRKENDIKFTDVLIINTWNSFTDS